MYSGADKGRTFYLRNWGNWLKFKAFDAKLMDIQKRIVTSLFEILLFGTEESCTMANYFSCFNGSTYW